MGPLSPSPVGSKVSPKPANPNPNLNPFSPLSPDLPENRLSDNDNNDLGRSQRQAQLDRVRATGVIYYPRESLLRIARKCKQQGWQAPPELGGLETWYGMGSPVRTFSQHLDDPAIASIGPPRRATGGFGEGFGFGGGIGNGRGIGRGGRNIGLRRQPEADTAGLSTLPERRDNFANPNSMGRFPPRNGKLEEQKMDRRPKRDEGEWRRDNRQPRIGESSRRPRYEEESLEPAWMDDAGGPSTTDLLVDDSLVQFVPGEDMIAAHKRAMKARDPGTDWRGEKTLAPFFGDPAVASASVPPGFAKPKEFDAAKYLRQSKADSDDDETETENNAFGSRFQRFFGGSAPAPMPPVQSPSEPAEPRLDEHMSKLMGLLSTKGAPQPAVAPVASSPRAGRSTHSPEASMPFFAPDSRQYQNAAYPPQPNALLQQLYTSRPDDPRPPPPPDALHLLAQRQHPSMSPPPPPPQHMSMPPGMFRNPLPSYPSRRDNLSPSDLLQDLQGYGQRGGPHPPFPGPPPPFYGPPPPGMHPAPMYLPGNGPGYRPDLGQAQQDMLATLFSGIEPRRN